MGILEAEAGYSKGPSGRQAGLQCRGKPHPSSGSAQLCLGLDAYPAPMTATNSFGWDGRRRGVRAKAWPQRDLGTILASLNYTS